MIADETRPRFTVRDVPVYGDVILAPMAGYADVPQRAIGRAYGSAMNYTEFVPVEELLGARRRDTPAWRLLDFKPDERPMTCQIFGSDPRKIVEAALRVQELGPDLIDINMGCSTRRVAGRGAGVGLMRTPQRVAETFRLLAQHVELPVTGKIRLGWEEAQNYLEIGRILQDNGCALVAIHPRTKEQRYSGAPRWEAIAELKQALAIPVIGNGDVTTPAEIDAMLAYTGCDAVMIGRGAIGNPWLFARKGRDAVTLDDVIDLVQLHAQEMVAYHGERGLLMFRKHLKRYLDDVERVDAVVSRLLTTEDVDDFLALLAGVRRDGRLRPARPAALPLPASAC